MPWKYPPGRGPEMLRPAWPRRSRSRSPPPRGPWQGRPRPTAISTRRGRERRQSAASTMSRPGRRGASQIGLQPRRQLHQLVRLQPQHRAAVVRTGLPVPASCGALGCTAVPDRTPRSPAVRLHFFGSNYRILFRIRTWFVGILVGSVFRPPRGRNPQLLEPRPRLGTAGFPGARAPNAAAAPGSRRQAPSPRAARPS